MRYLIMTFVILAFVSCNSSAKSSTPKNGGKTQVVDVQVVNVAADKAKALVDKGEVKVLDIRTPEEFAQGHIDGAININYRSADFEEKLAKLDKNQPYLMHCRSGRRSSNSMPIFKKLGFKKIYHLNRGINDWMRAGLPLKSGT